MFNLRHPGPRRVWDGGSEPQFLTPLPPPWWPRWPRRRIPETLKLLLYASLQSSRGPATLSCYAQARQLVRVAALPCRREHREINFRQKSTSDWECFLFVFLPDRAKRLVFTTKYPIFHNCDSQLANSTSGPRGASGIKLRPNLDPI